MNICMIFFEIIFDVVYKGLIVKCFKSGMFGVLVLFIYRSRKRDKFDDFDGIRSILLYRYIIFVYGYIFCLFYFLCFYCVICCLFLWCVCLRVDK